jgi:pentatricopeptide repeat protein
MYVITCLFSSSAYF